MKSEVPLEKRRIISNLIMETASKFRIKPSSEYLSHVLDSMMTLRIHEAEKIMIEIVDGYDTFPSLSAIKKLCDEQIRDRYQYAQPEKVANWISKQAPGTPAYVELHFELYESPESYDLTVEDRTRRLESFCKKWNLTSQQFDEAFEMWKNGKVHRRFLRGENGEEASR